MHQVNFQQIVLCMILWREQADEDKGEGGMGRSSPHFWPAE